MSAQPRSTLSDLDVLLSGKATLTLEGRGRRFTYRVRKFEDAERWSVGVLTGPDNETAYSYVGVVENGIFRTTAKSRLSPNAESVRAFVWMLGILRSGGNVATDNVSAFQPLDGLTFRTW